MAVLFETIKWLFFMMTIAFGLLLLRGEQLFAPSTVESLKLLFLPWYLVFCWIIVGYIIALFVVNKTQDSPEEQSKKYARSFLLGSFLGVGLAVSSIFII